MFSIELGVVAFFLIGIVDRKELQLEVIRPLAEHEEEKTNSRSISHIGEVEIDERQPQQHRLHRHSGRKRTYLELDNRVSIRSGSFREEGNSRPSIVQRTLPHCLHSFLPRIWIIAVHENCSHKLEPPTEQRRVDGSRLGHKHHRTYATTDNDGIKKSTMVADDDGCDLARGRL